MLSYQAHPGNTLWFPVTGADADVVIYSQILLARNLASLPFRHKMTSDDRLALRRRLETAFLEHDDQYRALDGGQLSPAMADLFRYRGYFADADAAPFTVIHRETGSFVRQGARDHLEISARAGGFDLHGPRSRCEHLDQVLEETLDYAVSLQLGYLRPDVAQVGTGLSARAVLHLSALEQSESIDVMERIGHGIEGEIRIDRSAGLYRVSYEAHAGEAEDETLATLAGYVERLLHYEREARDELVRLHGDAIAEAGHRALGTLLHARRLSASESAELFNVLRFAVAAGLVDDEITLPLVTDLMMMSHDTQVVMIDDETSATDVRRARLIQERYRGQAGSGVENDV